MTVPAVTPVTTPFGAVRLVWVTSGSGPKVQRIVLPGDTRPDPVAGDVSLDPDPADPRIEALVAGIQRFLDGHDVRFDLDILDLDLCPPFQGSVLLAESGIPRGYVSTYGRIARHIGRPGSARAVGNALARNPFPIVIPCHRAVRSGGGLGGFQGGIGMKRKLLEAEGIRFGGDGRVLMERVWYP